MSQPRVPQIFAGKRRDARAARAKALATREGAANWLYEELQRDVLERLDFMRFEPARALVTGHAAEGLAAQLQARVADVATPTSPDEEQPIVGAPYDLIVSHARLDTVNDLPGALLHLRNALAPGGLAIAQFPGAGSLSALRQVMLAADGERPAARLHPQIDDRAAAALMQRAGFAKQVVDTHRMTVRYRSFDRLITDLREQALTSVLVSPAPYVGKAGLARAKAALEAMKDQEGKVAETFQILTLTGWR
ncbi:methyltransferase domain-containing protein [Altererythrobacter litoralis]|uniref:Methyltransferase domain-containing protein n=1 Tax=Altererythrobacter litoralis TaxID=3113904 RepID=A0ABU7GH52_9SPHN|nr:methyltransferase domain-containing protein [Erythrobacteraceae bacterium 1XM1-14]